MEKEREGVHAWPDEASVRRFVAAAASAVDGDINK
jgi:hypothetical protein